MSEQTKPYFSFHINLSRCKDALEKFDELEKHKRNVRSAFGDSINCFIFPTDGESRVECVSPVFITADDSLQKKMDEIADKLKKLLEESK